MFPPKGLDKVSTYLSKGPGNKDPVAVYARHV